jgi:hypothetical protein
MPIATRGIARQGISRRGIATGGISVVDRVCYAYKFDGIDDRGVLANRAINIEGDNTFEFWTSSNLAVAQAIIAQNIMRALASREFELWHSSGSGMRIVFGGAETALFTSEQGLKAATRYGLTLTGTTAQIYEGGLNGTLVRTTTFIRGTAREPTAQTLIGCRGNNSGLFTGFFQGRQYDIRINGVLWEMGDRDQVIQPSTPAGNNMTLINTTSDRWQQVACRVNTTGVQVQGGQFIATSDNKKVEVLT